MEMQNDIGQLKRARVTGKVGFETVDSGGVRNVLAALGVRKPRIALMTGAGSIGSFLYYAPDLDLYMAGTIDQESDKITPIVLMIKVMRVISTAEERP